MAVDFADEAQVLAATLYGEARGEGEAGLEAVACVVLNRVRIARAGNRAQFGCGTVASCCLAPWQFSCWNEADPNRAKLLALDFDRPIFASEWQCLEIARRALAGGLPDTVDGATFYKVSSLPWPREWGRQVPPAKVIGRQSFYRLA
ncbi:MAG TPA: cell wall hydrolase [Rhizomicrobium sp.]